MPTIREVASLAGVGIATVSRALNGERDVSEDARRRVLAACETLGYRPSSVARSLVRGKTENVGVALMSRHAPVILNPFYAVVTGGVEEVLEANDYHLLLSSLKRNDDLLALAQEGRVDGLLVVGCDIADEVLEKLARTGLPTVLVDHSFPGLPSVTTDHFGGAYQATRHVIEGGRQRVAFVSENLDNPNFRARLAGFRRALEDAGLPYDPRLVAAGGNAWEGGYYAMRQILAAAAPPDAVVGANDPAAISAMRALLEAGLEVPRDVAVIGFDDLHLSAQTSPPLSSVHVDKQGLGRIGAELLIARLRGERSEPETRVLPTALVVRGSSGGRA
jgi:DNA-binding LacI/PurR family transcriptional regulator